MKYKWYAVGAALIIALLDIHLAVPTLLLAIILIPILKSIKPTGGYVYILKAGTYFKIGVTTGTVEGRVKELQTGSAKKIEIVHAIRTSDPYKLEKELHSKYSKKRKRGEWFDLSSYDVRKLKEL